MKIVNNLLSIFYYFDKVIEYVFDRSLFRLIYSYYLKHCYVNYKFNNKKLEFFCPSKEIKIRVKNIETKEPDTIKWIDNFKKKRNVTFWDIGSNIGLFSIYAAKINKKIQVISFEPSFGNLRILSRNIFINSLSKKICLYPLPLTDQSSKFLYFSESQFLEGVALNKLKKNPTRNEKNFYKTFSDSLDNLYLSRHCSAPNYMKIDVDGLEYLILKGATHILKNKKLTEILIEINENYTSNKRKILNKLSLHNFKFINKYKCNIDNKNSKEYNYLFKRK